MSMRLNKAIMGIFSKHLAFFVAILMQLIGAGFGIIAKASLNHGMNFLAYNCYRHAFSTLIMAPFAFFFHKNESPKLSLPILCKIFFVALCGPTVNFNVYFYALRLTSVTFACAIYNIIPVLTFIIALIMRLETVKCKSFYGGLKIVGMIAAVGGAMVLSFNRSPSKNLHISSPEGSSLVNESGDTKNDILGPILMFIAAVTFSLWLVLQAKVLEIYPARLRFNTLQWLFSTLQTGAAASAFERNIDSWKIGWNIELAFLVYAVVGVSGIQYVLQAWCVEKKGPFYVAMFYPLGLLISVIFSRFAWNERLSIGSMIGAIVITGGLYCVLWGRSKEGNQVVIAESQLAECNKETPKISESSRLDVETGN